MTPLQFIYVLTVTRPEMLTNGASEYEVEVLAEHFAYLETLAQSGSVLLAGRTQTDHPDTMGIVILAADSEQEAVNIMNKDPAVANKIMRAQLHPYKISLVSDRLSQL